MILKQVNFKGLVVAPYQIKNNKCYYFKNGERIDFPYRLTQLPEYYVAGEGLYGSANTIAVDESSDSAIFSSLYHFNVSGETLNIH